MTSLRPMHYLGKMLCFALVAVLHSAASPAPPAPPAPPALPAPTAPSTSPSTPLSTSAPFDAVAAWREFEGTFRGAYAYLDGQDFDVDDHLRRVREAAVAAPDAHQFRRVLQAGTWAFCDPHLLVGPLDDDEPNVWPTSGDLAVDAAGVVTDVRADAAADAAGVRPGDLVVAVDGVALDAAVRRLLWLVPSPTTRQRRSAATIVVNGRRDDRPRTLTLTTAQGRRELAIDNPRLFARAQAERPPLTVTRLGKVAVLRLANSLGRSETITAFDAAVAGLGPVEAVVLDLRNTPSGGNTDVARAIIGHFIDDVRPYQVHEIPAVLRRTTVPRRFVEYAFPRAPRVRAPLYVLAGRWTGSMGEGLVVGLDAAAAATTVASDMGDLLGALGSFHFDTFHGTLELGTESLFHVDGTPRAAYVADVQLPTADRDAAGRDPGLAAALARHQRR